MFCLFTCMEQNTQREKRGRRSRGSVRKKQTKQEGGQREQEKKGDQGRYPPDQVNNHLKMGRSSLFLFPIVSPPPFFSLIPIFSFFKVTNICHYYKEKDVKPTKVIFLKERNSSPSLSTTHAQGQQEAAARSRLSPCSGASVRKRDL